MLKLPEKLRTMLSLRRMWWSTLIGWAFVVFALSAIPGASMPQLEFANFDKIEHTFFFSVGAFLLTGALAVTFSRWSWHARIALAVAGISMFGWLDEWHQTFTPGRSGNDIYDWISDTIGAMIGAGGARWLFHYACNPRRIRSLDGGAIADRSPAATDPGT